MKITLVLIHATVFLGIGQQLQLAYSQQDDIDGPIIEPVTIPIPTYHPNETDGNVYLNGSMNIPIESLKMLPEGNTEGEGEVLLPKYAYWAQETPSWGFVSPVYVDEYIACVLNLPEGKQKGMPYYKALEDCAWNNSANWD